MAEVTRYLEGKLKVRLVPRYVENLAYQFNGETAGDFQKQLVSARSTLVFLHMLQADITQFYLLVNRKVLEFFKHAPDQRKSDQKILLYEKRNKHSQRPQVVQLTEPFLVQIEHHDKYDVVQPYKQLELPLQLIVSANGGRCPLLVVSINNLGEQQVTLNYLAPGAKILIQQCTLVQLGTQKYIKTGNCYLLGGGMIEKLAGYVQNLDRQQLINKLIKIKNDQIRDQLEREQQDNYSRLRDQMHENCASSYQFRYINLCDIR